MKRIKVVAVMFCLGFALLSGAKADEENKKTIASFNHRFEIPGGQVLPAGRYVFKVLNPSGNPNVIQILSEDEKHLYATIMAIAKYRSRQTEKTVMTFSSRTNGAPEAIRTWFYPGSTRGVEFIYPKQPRAVDLARLASKPAPPKPVPIAKKPPKVASKRHKRVKPVPPPAVATEPAPATVAALPGIQPTKEKFGVNIDVLNRVPVEFPEASREPAPARPQQVPRKVNVMADLIVVGLILGALVLLLLSMRRVRGAVTRKSAARAGVKKEGRKAA